MYKKFLAFVLFFPLVCSGFAQFSFKRILPEDTIIGNTFLMEKLDDSSFVFLTEVFNIDPARLPKSNFYPSEHSDLCLQKIDIHGNVIKKIIFSRVEYEKGEQICMARDGLYIVSSAETSDNIQRNKFLGIKKLDLQAEGVLIDTVIYTRLVTIVNCFQLSQGGIGLIYDVPYKRGACNTIQIDQFDTNGNYYKIKSLPDSNYFLGVVVESSLKDSLLYTIYRNNYSETGHLLKELSPQIVLSNMSGETLSRRNYNTQPVYATNDGYMLTEPCFTQIDHYKPGENMPMPRFTYTNRAVFILSDTAFNTIKTITLVPDTSLKSFYIPICQKISDGYLLAASFGNEDTSKIILYKINEKGDLIWERRGEFPHYNVGIRWAFETKYGYSFFASGNQMGTQKPVDYSWLMMQLDKSGNLIPE